MRKSTFAVSAALVLAACANGERGENLEFTSNRISVVTQGRGPDIILIPGLFSHRDVWGGVADQLDDRYRLHLIQVNGFAGVAPDANADGPVAAPVAEEIARYIREARLEAPAVVGHSLGGSIGIMLAARHPDSVRRLMVVDSMPFMGIMFGPPGTTAEGVRPLADQMRVQILAEPPGSAKDLIAQMIATMTRTDAMRPVLLDYARRSHRPTVAEAFHEGIVTDLRPELARIANPVTVLYVVPPNAPMTPEQFDSAVRASFASARHARLVRIENSAHFIQIDQPVRFISEVDTFMGR